MLLICQTTEALDRTSMAKSHIQLARADLQTLQEPEEGHIIIIKTNNLTIKPKLI